MYATHEKLVEFNRAQQELVTREIDVEEDVEYLKAFNAIFSLLDRIQDIKKDFLSKSKQSMTQTSVHKSAQKTQNDDLRCLLLKTSKVNTLKRICIDFFNKHGPDLVDTYLKCGTPDKELKRSDTKGRSPKKGSKKKRHNKRPTGYKSFGGRKKKRSRTVVLIKTNLESGKPSCTLKKVTPKSPVVTPVTQESPANPSTEQEDLPTTRRRSRTLSRVNYVDDIPESVLFYVERQESKRRKMEEKVILESIKEASKQQQQMSSSELLDMSYQGTFNTNPLSEIKINSAVSVPPLIESLVLKRNGFNEFESTQKFSEDDLLPHEIVSTKSECQFCGLICDNLKILAIHNMEHLSLRLRRIGEKESLPVNLRRGMMYRERGYAVVRCSSCLKSFRNADQIKQHWNTKNCDYYCKICYLSFHRNPELINDHLLSVHGIRKEGNRPLKIGNPDEPLKMLENMASFEQLTSTVKSEIVPEPKNSPSGSSGFKLKVRSVSMINASAPPLNTPDPDHFSIHRPINEVPPEVPPLQYTTQFNQEGGAFHQYQPQFLPPQISYQRAVCHICHCSFPNINSRNSHMKVHKRLPESSTSRPSSLGFSMSSSMSYPIGSSMNNDYHLNVRPCGFRYYNRAEFIQHRSECKDCRYACTMCEKSFQAGSELQMHLMLEHPRSLSFKR